jgi:hypothetical protein
MQHSAQVLRGLSSRELPRAVAQPFRGQSETSQANLALIEDLVGPAEPSLQTRGINSEEIRSINTPDERATELLGNGNKAIDLSDRPYPAWLQRFEYYPVLAHILAFMRKETHIGFGIFYNFENCMMQFSEKEQTVLRKGGVNAVEITMARLGNGRLDIPADGRDLFVRGHEMFMYDDPSGYGGVCRHKTTIMTRFLTDLNISCRRVVFEFSEGTKVARHSVVHIPCMDRFADPTISRPDRPVYLTKKELVDLYMPYDWSS